MMVENVTLKIEGNTKHLTIKSIFQEILKSALGSMVGKKSFAKKTPGYVAKIVTVRKSLSFY